MADIAVVLRNCYNARQLPSWGEIHDAAAAIDRLHSHNALLLDALKCAHHALDGLVAGRILPQGNTATIITTATKLAIDRISPQHHHGAEGG